MFRIFTLHGLLAAATLSWAGCAYSTQQQRRTSSPEEAIVVVQNNNLAEMDIYAVEGYSRWRLGTVPTGSTVTLRIPRALWGRPEIQLQAVPRGEYSPFTFQRVPLTANARIQLSIASLLSMSMVVW